MAEDEYQRQYLGGDSALYREKRVSHKTFWIMSAITGLNAAFAAVALGTFIFGGDWQGLGAGLLWGALSAMLGVLSVALSVARVSVTATALRFMVGIRQLVVPLASITSTSLGVINPRNLRVDAGKDRAEMASIFGADRYVRVTWSDGKKERVTWIGSDSSEALRDAIERVRSGANIKARVEVAEAAPDELEEAQRDAAGTRQHGAERSA